MFQIIQKERTAQGAVILLIDAERGATPRQLMHWLQGYMVDAYYSIEAVVPNAYYTKTVTVRVTAPPKPIGIVAEDERGRRVQVRSHNGLLCV